MNDDFILGYMDAMTKLGFDIDVDMFKKEAAIKAPGGFSNFLSSITGRGRTIGSVPKPGGTGIKQKLKSGYDFVTKGRRVKPPKPPSVPKPEVPKPEVPKPPAPTVPAGANGASSKKPGLKRQALIGLGGVGAGAYIMNQKSPQQPQQIQQPYSPNQVYWM